MKKYFITIQVFFLLVICLSVIGHAMGSAWFRYAVISQEKKGPQGGALTLIDRRISEYVEFVAKPGPKEWLLQVYFYDNDLKPTRFSGKCILDIEMPGGEQKTINLLSTKPEYWSWPFPGNEILGHYENTIALGEIREFKVKMFLKRRKSKDHLEFKYPY